MWTDFAMAVSNAIRAISCRTGYVGPQRSFWIADNVCKCSRVGLTLPSFTAELVASKSKACSRSSSKFSMIPFKLTPDTELLEIVYVGDRFGGNWHFLVG